MQSYWRYQHTVNMGNTTGTNNSDEALWKIEEEEVYENDYENNYDIDEIF